MVLSARVERASPAHQARVLATGRRKDGCQGRIRTGIPRINSPRTRPIELPDNEHCVGLRGQGRTDTHPVMGWVLCRLSYAQAMGVPAGLEPAWCGLGNRRIVPSATGPRMDGRAGLEPATSEVEAPRSYPVELPAEILVFPGRLELPTGRLRRAASAVPQQEDGQGSRRLTGVARARAVVRTAEASVWRLSGARSASHGGPVSSACSLS